MKNEINKIKGEANQKGEEDKEEKKNDRFYYKKDRLNQLRGFCTTVQEGYSATKAANMLGLQPATVGQQIKSLESELGVDLFDRNHTNKLVITPEGQKFFDTVVLALQGIDGIFRNFRKDIEEERKNTLRIASVDAILGKMIKYTVEFKEKNPNVNITLFNIPRDKAFRGLIENTIDLAFYPSEFEEKFMIEFEREFIANYKSYWVLYKDHPLASKDEKEITKKEIAKFSFGYLPEHIYIKSFRKFIEENNLKSPIDLKNGTVEFLKEMIRQKICISALDDFYINEKDRENFVLKSSTDNFSSVGYYLFLKKEYERIDIMEKFIKTIKDNKDEIFS